MTGGPPPPKARSPCEHVARNRAPAADCESVERSVAAQPLAELLEPAVALEPTGRQMRMMMMIGC